MDNYVHDNNNPDVPGAGAAGASPVGTGMSISGGRFDTVMGNRIVHNGSWGLLLVPFPDTGTPPPVAHCQGGTETGSLGYGCLYDNWGNQVLDNKFSANGFFANPTNGDIGQITFFGGNPVNCFSANKLPDGFSPATLLVVGATCGKIASSGEINQPLLEQVECNTQILSSKPCPPGSSYPRQTKVTMHPLPKAAQVPSMPNPCAGVPANPWCKPVKPPRGPWLRTLITGTNCKPRCRYRVPSGARRTLRTHVRSNDENLIGGTADRSRRPADRSRHAR